MATGDAWQKPDTTPFADSVLGRGGAWHPGRFPVTPRPPASWERGGATSGAGPAPARAPEPEYPAVVLEGDDRCAAWGARMGGCE